ncbi:hypothetical protein GQ53DRAFT_804860 [Thozetella sp. PMI_491]|nr:hypothetical protein GQ53DRAFT_804860 [Thozetella sp. PMI_491]
MAPPEIPADQSNKSPHEEQIKPGDICKDRIRAAHSQLHLSTEWGHGKYTGSPTSPPDRDRCLGPPFHDDCNSGEPSHSKHQEQQKAYTSPHWELMGSRQPLTPLRYKYQRLCCLLRILSSWFATLPKRTRFRGIEEIPSLGLGVYASSEASFIFFRQGVYEQKPEAEPRKALRVELNAFSGNKAKIDVTARNSLDARLRFLCYGLPSGNFNGATYLKSPALFAMKLKIAVMPVILPTSPTLTIPLFSGCLAKSKINPANPAAIAVAIDVPSSHFSESFGCGISSPRMAKLSAMSRVSWLNSEAWSSVLAEKIQIVLNLCRAGKATSPRFPQLEAAGVFRYTLIGSLEQILRTDEALNSQQRKILQ